uniref:Uncharacterized protein n=1 Tax=Romanomermis culicivorax TaxID=13658 RepID=A0A915IKJ3_ROMCU
MGMSNGMGTFAGMICPAVTEKLTKTYKVRGWETVFLLAGMIHLTGVLFYAIFASGEKQPWAEPPEDEENEAPAAARAKIGSIGYGTMTNNGNDGDLNYQSFQINNKKYSNASNLSGTETLTGKNGRHDSSNVRHSDIYAGIVLEKTD